MISFLLAGLFQVPLPSQRLSKQVVVQPSFSVSSKPLGVDFVYLENILPILGELNDRVCGDVPSGIGIPGFQPGSQKNDVTRMLGVPTVSASGYWPRTRAVSYELIPEQVSLGFLFDRKSERLRQTEAAFTPGIESEEIELMLNGMLGCKLNEEIKQGLKQVRQRQSPRYSFTAGSLKGVIERDRRDRIYIGIWERDLH